VFVLQVELERDRQERLQQLTDLYVKTASGVGKAHREAVAEVRQLLINLPFYRVLY